MSVATIYGSGNVRRYHANPRMAHLGQTNADHQGRCVQLLLLMHPSPSVELITAVAFHDAGERWVGDLPGPFKQREPDLASAHAEIEAELLQRELGWDVLGCLDAQDARWLVFIDKLEAFAFMATHAPGQAQRDGWVEARRALVARAWSLDGNGGVAARLNAFFDELDRGAW